MGGGLQFTVHKKDVLEKKNVGNLSKFDCPKAGLDVILEQLFPIIMNKWEGAFI